MANSGSGENIGSVLAGAAGSALSSLPAAFAQERQQTLDNIITTMNLQRQIQAEELQQQQSLRQEQQATRQQAQFEQQTLINTANLERLTINNSLADINLREATEFSLLDPAGKAAKKQEAAFAEAEATLDQVLGDVPGLANMDFSQKLIAVDELDRQGLKLDFGDIGLSFAEPKAQVVPISKDTAAGRRAQTGFEIKKSQRTAISNANTVYQQYSQALKDEIGLQAITSVKELQEVLSSNKFASTGKVTSENIRGRQAAFGFDFLNPDEDVPVNAQRFAQLQDFLNAYVNAGISGATQSTTSPASTKLTDPVDIEFDSLQQRLNELNANQ